MSQPLVYDGKDIDLNPAEIGMITPSSWLPTHPYKKEIATIGLAWHIIGKVSKLTQVHSSWQVHNLTVC